MITGDLEKYACVRSALVSLTGRMQIPRAETETGRGAFPVAHGNANLLQRAFGFARGGYIGQKREVIACRNPVEMALHVLRKRVRARQRGAICAVGVERYSICRENRLLLRIAMLLFKLGGQLARLFLGRFDIRLIEGI